MPYDKLKEIKWYDQEMVTDFKRRVANIDGTLCRILTVNDLTPGSFGIRMKTGKLARVLVVNNLPYENVTCGGHNMHNGHMEMAPTNTEPGTTNLHMHGFWGNAEDDNVYACVKPHEQYQYRYHINKNHPTGLYIVHNHNSSSATTIDHITTFIVQVVNQNRKKYDYPKEVIQRTLFIMQNYMQKCDLNDPDGCELEAFDFPKYASGDFDTYAKLLKEGPKLILVNGQIKPYEEFPTGVPVILRIAWMGILDTLNLQILDDQGNPITFRVLSIDSLPIAKQCESNKCGDGDDDNIKVQNSFLAAHMQRFDIMVVFDRARQYRLMKIGLPDADNDPFSSGTNTLMFINASCKYKTDTEDSKNHSGPNKPDQCLICNLNVSGCECGKDGKKCLCNTKDDSGKVHKSCGCDCNINKCECGKDGKKCLCNTKDHNGKVHKGCGCDCNKEQSALIPASDINKLSYLRLKNPYWVKYVNNHFRNMTNIIAWRTIRFNYPKFPLIEGEMMDFSVKPAQVNMVANRSEVWLVGSQFADDGIHSIHIHLMWFLLMASRPNDKAEWKMIPKEKQWFVDTLTILPGQQHLIWMFPFADPKVSKERRATGLAMLHCHMADHADSGMMVSMMVSDAKDAKPSGLGLVDGPQSEKIIKITKKSSCS